MSKIEIQCRYEWINVILVDEKSLKQYVNHQIVTMCKMAHPIQIFLGQQPHFF